MSQRTSDFVFQGGMDPSTSPLLLSPSRCMSALNYEAVAEGYRRLEGIERFDGQPAPSQARFWVLTFIQGSALIATGDRIAGGTSGATAWVVRADLDDGAWDGSAAGKLVLTDVVGEFLEEEALKRAGVTVAVADSLAEREAVSDYETFLDFTALAQDLRRTAIQKPAGSGPIRGVTIFQGIAYAWRDNAEGTAGVMWKATPTGWQVVPASRWTGFIAGNTEINEGDVITGATSGATATVIRMKKYKGNWGQNSAEGFLVLLGGSGTFVNEDVRRGSTYLAHIYGEEFVRFPPGGRYTTIEHNFYGSAPRTALYIANGVGNAFEFMNGVLSPVETFTPDDRPTHIFEVANHLGLCFRGGSVQVSVPGEPLLFDSVQGAFEFGFGNDITDVVQANDSAVVLFGRSKIGTLTGKDVATFQFSELTEEAGAEPWTAQRLGRTIYIDVAGLRDLSATQAYGNFRAGTLLPEMQAFFLSRTRSGARPILSYLCRAKTQYRVMWDDGVGLSVYMGRKTAEAMPFDVSPLRFTTAANGLIDNQEIMLCGGEDGFVYRIDSGPSLDGDPISAFVQPPFNHIGSPNQEKRLHKVTVEIDGLSGANIGVSVVFDYGEEGQPNALLPDQRVYSGGRLWDAANWDEFYWSGPVRGRGEFPADGLGRNIGLVIAAVSKPAEIAHTLQAYTLHWSLRKFVR